MKIHTSASAMHVIHAAQEVGVSVLDISKHGSRSRKHRLDIKLTGHSPYRTMANDGQAASWDEWGMFIERVFRLDPDAIVGMYPDYDSFQMATYRRFDDLTPAQAHHKHNWYAPGDYTSSCECGAQQRWDWKLDAREAVSA
jgi:hypothetical protein